MSKLKTAGAVKRFAWEVVLTVRSPFLFQGLANALMGVDAVQLRDEKGQPIIPADQVRGVLREAVGWVVEAGATALGKKDLEAIFGPALDRGAADRAPDLDRQHREQNRPERSALIFGDLAATSMRRGDGRNFEPLPAAAAEWTRVAIDDETGAAKPGHLQIIEQVAPFGAEVEFRGRITAFLADAKATEFKKAVTLALQLIPAIGAFKSAGFGEVIAARSRIGGGERVLALTLPTAPALQNGDTRRTFRVTFDRPLLVDATWVADNAYEGNTIVPGAVIKGALARRLTLAGEDPEGGAFAAALSELHISHGFPETEDGRPSGRALPLSLVAVKGGNEEEDQAEATYFVGDALAVPYERGAMIDGKAAWFVPDWKEGMREAAFAVLGRPRWDEPERLPRTHTAIDDGVAEDEKLFTTIARSTLRPGHWSLPGESRGWLLTIDGGRVQDKARLAILFALLEQGLDGIGKTGAHATLTRIGEQPAPEAQCVHGRADHYAVVIETPALMLDPRQLGASVRQQYETYFKTHLGADLVNFFASQRLAGRYLATRRRFYGDFYYPFVLTEPGSVFFLRISSADLARLSDALRFGLPPIGGKIDWKACPFVPANGFGAITADYLSTEAMAALLKRLDHA